MVVIWWTKHNVLTTYKVKIKNFRVKEILSDFYET
jgi:hypothetical protein